MRKVLLIAQREYNSAVRTKAFIISLVLMPILMGGGFLAQALLKDRVDTTDKKVAIVDRSGVLADVLVAAAESHNQEKTHDQASGKKIRPQFLLEVVPPRNDEPRAQRLELSRLVNQGQYFAFVDIGAKVVRPSEEDPESARVGYYSKNPVYDDVRNLIAPRINEQVYSLRFAGKGIEPSQLAPVRVESYGLLSMDERTGEIKDAERSNEALALLMPMAFMMIMFMMVMMGAAPLINSVLEEKMQRISEVLLGSVDPFTLMMGKLLGTIGVSLTVVAVYMAGAAVTTQKLGVADVVPWHLLTWFFVYQVSAVFMFGAVFIAIGAACSDLKEAQSLMTPVWLLLCAPMFVWFNVVKEPLSGFSTGMSLIPTFAPMLMLLRQASPVGIPAWQPWVGLAGVIVTTVLCVWAAGRIFRVGLLMQGKPPKLRELAKWAISG